MNIRHAPGSMVEGHKALTEKEKQTLRLLLGGHDAKSMARHLDLSVHTVNERLRDARRKLSVSSSKEAARLLRQSEGAGEAADPETLGDEHLGDAAPAAIDHHAEQPATAPRLKRPTVWAIGGLAMIAFVTALLALSAPADAPQAPATATVKSDAASPAILKAANDFLTFIDAANWPASYAATGQQFHAANTLQLWQSTSEQVRAPLGRVLSRKLVSDQIVPAPPKGYWMIRFQTEFANKAGVIETVSLAREDGNWKVVGVLID